MGQIFHFLITVGYQISPSFVDVFCCCVYAREKIEINENRSDMQKMWNSKERDAGFQFGE